MSKVVDAASVHGSSPGPIATATGRSGGGSLSSGIRGRIAAVLSSVCLMLVLMAGLAFTPSAYGAWGDHFGIAPINGADAQTVPALPGEQMAYWAGTCVVANAPAFGEQIEGGIGSRPDTVLAPDGGFNFGGFNRTPVPAPATPPHCLDWGAPGDYPAPHEEIWFESPSWRLPPETQAGARPDGSLTMALARSPDGGGTSGPGIVDGSLDNIYVDLPSGFVGDPTAVPKCSQEKFAKEPLDCPSESQVGTLHLVLLSTGLFGNLSLGSREDLYPVYNLAPRKGNVAELGFGYASELRSTPFRIAAKARTNGDFGVTTFVGQIPAALPVIQQQITLWGVPWAASNDILRFPQGRSPLASGCSDQPGTSVTHYIPPGGLREECQVSYDQGWGPIKPFLTNPTECAPGELTTTLMMDQYLHPGPFTADGDPVAGHPNWKTYGSQAAPVTGCEKLQFDADIDFSGASSAADSASGLSVDLELPQNNEPPATVAQDPGDPTDPDSGAPGHWRSDQGLATAQLDRAVVTLPSGMSVNPSAATGLAACTDVQIGVRQMGNPPLFNNGDPFNKDGGADGAECPDASKLGTVTARTPLLDEPLTGEVVLGEPKSTDPTSGQMLRLFLLLRNPERGLMAKVYGSTVANPATGQLTTTFDKNPRVPVEHFELEFKGGSRGILATPQNCTNHPWNATFTPWTAAHGGGGQPVADNGVFAVNRNCGSGFSPSLHAGMDTQAARGYGTFSFRFARRAGEQWLRGLTARLPQGLLASVRGLPLCTNAQANAGRCPAASKIGIVDAKAGSGNPFVLERKGEVFLTEGYKGGPYGLAVKIRPIAGPFRGAMELSPIIVRQAIHVDPRTAEVTAISDPFPLIHHGVPLRVREVTVIVNRSNFMLNPSDCSRKQVGATIRSAQGRSVDRRNHFQVRGCAALPFEPEFSMQVLNPGFRSTRRSFNPAMRFIVTQQGVGEAGIKGASVILPSSVILDQSNIRTVCTRPQFAADNCPDRAIYGYARAWSPLLNEPVEGPVYLGSSPNPLPDIIADLGGEIRVVLQGEVDGVAADRRGARPGELRGARMRNTFNVIPDAPVSRFELTMFGGRNRGVLVNSRDLCTSRERGHAVFHGHNGRVSVQHPPVGMTFRRCAQVRRVMAKRRAARKRQARRAAIRQMANRGLSRAQIRRAIRR